MKSKKRFYFILGTRPEVIKLSSLINKLKSEKESVIVVNTGQQQELTAEFLKDFKIEANVTYNLSDKRSLNLDLSQILSNLFATLKDENTKNTFIFVQGDTTTALAGALTGFNLSIPVFHIEAGLRTGNTTAPFPEEMYRVLISQLSTHHFAPTQKAVENLVLSGVDEKNITMCGNTGIDVLVERLKFEKKEVNRLQRRILVTLHRRENFGENIFNLTQALDELSHQLTNTQIEFICHSNPKVLESYHPKFVSNSNIIKSPPKSYVKLIEILRHSDILITDSGGLQEESAFLGIPLIVAREVTERQEVLGANCALCSTDPIKIKETTVRLLCNDAELKKFTNSTKMFGEGKSTEIIIDKLQSMEIL